MCGIVGIIGLGKPVNNVNEIFSMMKVQKHRGPDDEGAVAYNWVNENSMEVHENLQSECDFDGVLGFNRLSIVDVSRAGHQPMRDLSEKVILIFNGEIYNANILKQKIRADEYTFRSRTDTEVILALYLKYGFENMICQLNGMFALCIVDLRIHKIYIARDRFGVKPLYYKIARNRLLFASEYKSICTLETEKTNLDVMALSELFNFRNSINRTLVEEIKPLLPGEMMTINDNYEVLTQKYFDINKYHRWSNFEKVKDFESDIYERLKTAVKRQMVSDVTLGCQLSGGIDSSLITYIASLCSSKALDTVSITFNDNRFSEKQWIDEVKGRVGTNQHEFLFETRQFIQLLELSVWHLESVETHPNTICLLWLTHKAREYVTVLLSGEGADELFAGYPRFLLGVTGKSSENLIRATTTIPDKNRHAIFTEIKDDFVMEERKEFLDKLSGSIFEKQVKYEFLNYLPELLIRQDKMSMANSIENRVPFLDNELVDYVFSLPENILCKYQNGMFQTKMPLKNISTKIFGADFTYRKKMGFSVPVQNYIKNIEFQNYFYDMILPRLKTRGLFNAEIMERLYLSISKEKYDYVDVETFWRALTAEIWCQLYLDKRKMLFSDLKDLAI